MGTHPIFESDFDCLTEKHDVASIGRTQTDAISHLAESS